MPSLQNLARKLVLVPVAGVLALGAAATPAHADVTSDAFVIEPFRGFPPAPAINFYTQLKGPGLGDGSLPAGAVLPLYTFSVFCTNGYFETVPFKVSDPWTGPEAETPLQDVATFVGAKCWRIVRTPSGRPVTFEPGIALNYVPGHPSVHYDISSVAIVS